MFKYDLQGYDLPKVMIYKVRIYHTPRSVVV